MNASKFSMEFELNIAEVRKLNKMYFKRLYKARVTVFSIVVLIFLICLDLFNLNNEEDFIKWELRSVVLIVLFLMFHYSLVNTICRIIFQLSEKVTDYRGMFGSYKFNFTNSSINVHSPLGAFAHKWSQIEKAILTKDFFFLYVQDEEHHVISISNKCNKGRNINKLIEFVQSNVTEITKM